MGKEIQTRVHINDITPTESYWEIVDDKHEPRSCYTKEELYESIKRDGIKYQLRIAPTGEIINGNMRYWTARRLFLEGDRRFEYLPVEKIFFTGLMDADKYAEFPGKKGILKVQQKITELLNTNQPVVPVSNLEEYIIDDDHIGGHPIAFEGFIPCMKLVDKAVEALEKYQQEETLRRKYDGRKWLFERYDPLKTGWVGISPSEANRLIKKLGLKANGQT